MSTQLINMLKNNKPFRKSQPVVERLGSRIAPTTFPMAAALVAELRVENHQVHKWETSLSNAVPGSRRERLLTQRIAGESRLIGRQDVRLASIESRATGSGTVGGSQSTLPANVSLTLAVIYNAYEQNPGGFPANVPTTDGANMVVIQGNNVGIQVHDGNPADFNSLLNDLQSDGMQVTLSSAEYGTIVGMLPISQLPAVGALPQMPSITAEMQPVLD